MTDIVERLRDWEWASQYGCEREVIQREVADEAADEIERLRADMDIAITAMQAMRMVSLPPHDVSGTAMWNDAGAAYMGLRERYRPAPLSN